VVVPLNGEWQLRINKEYRKAKSEGRGARKIPRPPLPKFDVKTGKISYENYKTLQKSETP